MMLLELMEIPEIADDEDILCWMWRIAEANGWDYRSFAAAFFPGNYIRKHYKLYSAMNYAEIYNLYKDIGFPDLQKTLFQHTDIVLSGLFSSPFDTGIKADILINGTDSKPFGRTFRIHAPFRYCPVCAGEDKEHYGSVIAHVPHQVKGVNACYIHGVKLSEEPESKPEKTLESEIKTAQMVYALYKAGTVGTVKDITKSVSKRAKEHKLKYKSFTNNHPMVDTEMMRVAAELFTVDELIDIYKKCNTDWEKKSASALKSFSRKSEVISWDNPFITYRCGWCGKVTTSYAVTLMTGGICPSCSERTQWQAKMARRAAYCLEKDFRIARFTDRTECDVRHLICGTTTRMKTLRIMRVGNFRCEKCRELERSSLVGMERMMNCGKMAKVIKVRLKDDIDVVFEDGTVMKHVNAYSFFAGQTTPPINRVGEEQLMKCGTIARIIAYRNHKDIDIQFETGEIREHRSYARFKKGQISPVPGISVVRKR